VQHRLQRKGVEQRHRETDDDVEAAPAGTGMMPPLGFTNKTE
jgi:hypothetical protein